MSKLSLIITISAVLPVFSSAAQLTLPTATFTDQASFEAAATQAGYMVHQLGNQPGFGLSNGILQPIAPSYTLDLSIPASIVTPPGVMLLGFGAYIVNNDPHPLQENLLFQGPGGIAQIPGTSQGWLGVTISGIPSGEGQTSATFGLLNLATGYSPAPVTLSNIEYIVDTPEPASSALMLLAFSGALFFWKRLRLLRQN